MKHVKLIALLLLLWFVFIPQQPAQSDVDCCVWMYYGDYTYWYTDSDPYYGWRLCYSCGPYPTKCYYYTWQNGHWGIANTSESSCSPCPRSSTCDGAVYLNCDTGGIHAYVMRLINTTPPGGMPLCGWGNSYQCTAGDRWIEWYSPVQCNTL